MFPRRFWCHLWCMAYDQFTVFFHGGRVYISEKNYSVGQCCVDILNLNERILDELEQRVQDFVPAAWTS